LHLRSSNIIHFNQKGGRIPQAHPYKQRDVFRSERLENGEKLPQRYMPEEVIDRMNSGQSSYVIYRLYLITSNLVTSKQFSSSGSEVDRMQQDDM
jgi:hypothetical protein